MVGKTLGHYEILEPLGKGGMGEVYRARDTKLKREVAIKVLPEELSADPDRLARLEREAHLLAALNHPNIATIHSLEQHEDTRFLVLELVKGESLEQRLAKGPLPPEAALDLCKQIAEALEAAHGEGIIHRDLKPANILITPQGRAKVLDFGLAKAFEGQPSAGDLSQSPTLTVAGTQTGVILGTAPYMSPEQVRGQPLDKRVDIWAFGCVVYEALTASRAFARETVADTLAAIIESEPNFGALPGSTPPMVGALVKRCLRKDPDRRLHDIADARIEIEEALSGGTDAVSAMLGSPAAVETARGVPWKLAVPTVVGALIIGGAATWWATLPSPPEPGSPIHLQLDPAVDTILSRGGSAVVLSPDGLYVAYVEGDPLEGSALHLRALDQQDSTTLASSETLLGSPFHPFFSPDGQWVGFATTRELKKASITGGTPQLITEARLSQGADWGPDDTIVYTPNRTSGLLLVSAVEGEPRPLTELAEGEFSHRWPQFLPGGKAVLFTSAETGDFDGANLEVVDLETGDRQVVHRGGTYGRYVPTGHLVYSNAGALFAVPFDLDTLETSGSPIPVVENLAADRSFPGAGGVSFDFSETGMLVYHTRGGGGTDTFQLVWVDRSGRAEPVSERRGAFRAARLSPDGRRIAVEVTVDGAVGVWILGIEDDSFAPLNNEGTSAGPLWTPDSQTVLFRSTLGGIYARDASFGSEREEILQTDDGTFPISWSGDGEDLVLHEMIDGVQGQRRILVVPFVGEDRTPFAP
ncbi:MAG: protein kinase, partial [Acidimicrobiia bacterium]